MKRAFAIALALGLAFSASALPRATVALSAVVTEDLANGLSLDQALNAFQTTPPFAGLGWEVVVGHIGFGGVYEATTFQDGASDWWLDWYSQAFFVSYHLLGAGAGLDPYLRSGVGCAGRVGLSPGASPASLELALFPVLGAGLEVRLGALNLGATVDYTPMTGAVPATFIPLYDLGSFQVSALAGFKLGGRRF